MCTLDVITTCPICSESTMLTVDRDGYDRWQGGELVQNALPDLTSDQRELLLSGICPPCWTKSFGE